MQQEQDNQYLSFKETRKIIGVTPRTLRNWDKEGKIRTIRTPSGARMFNKLDLQDYLKQHKTTQTFKPTVCYARVSSRNQLGDLERQIHFLKQAYPQADVVTDICSGIHWKRKGLSSILERAIQGELGEIVFAHRDRLCRFAFELYEHFFTMCKVKVTILDHDSSASPDIELADDILSIVHVYSSRQMGKRRYKQKESKVQEQAKE
jgi:predicted site-specific integrase-resolvase